MCFNSILAMVMLREVFEMILLGILAMGAGFLAAWLYLRHQNKATITEFMDQLKAARSRIVELRGRLNKVQPREDESARNKKVIKDNHALRRQLLTLNTQLGEAQLIIEELEEENIALKSKYSSSQDEVNQLLGANEMLRKQVLTQDKQLKAQIDSNQRQTVKKLPHIQMPQDPVINSGQSAANGS